MKNSEDKMPLKSNNMNLNKELFALGLANPELSWWQLISKMCGDAKITLDGKDVSKFKDKLK